ncbi:MAG: DUF481 domain-containing protein [Candidatus Electrothrix sp. AR3]|nr:DUF481 domain-containing protein [Candidatus Electrothrix sp. AR3]
MPLCNKAKLFISTIYPLPKKEIMLKNSTLSSAAALMMLLSLSAGGSYADGSVSSNMITQMNKNVPLEDLSELDKSKIWSAELSLGLNMTSGNSNTLSSNINFSGSRKVGADVFEIVLEGAYGESEIEQESDGTTTTKGQKEITWQC